jgi:small subunit ribosomal protein S21
MRGLRVSDIVNLTFLAGGILWGESMPLRMRIHDREPIGAALRRFKKLLERSGMQKELRKRKYYEKPCEARRRAKLRKQSTARKGKMPARSRTSW